MYKVLSPNFHVAIINSAHVTQTRLLLQAFLLGTQALIISGSLNLRGFTCVEHGPVGLLF